MQLHSGRKVWVSLVRDCRNFGWIRTVVVMSLISTVTNCLVCLRTVPCFPPCLGWLMMFILLLIGKSLGVLMGDLMGMSLGGMTISIVSLVVVAAAVMASCDRREEYAFGLGFFAVASNVHFEAKPCKVVVYEVQTLNHVFSCFEGEVSIVDI